MSRALMSSRALTAICCSLLSRILRVGSIRVKVVLVNIAQNRGGKQGPDGIPAGGTPRKLCTNGGRGDGKRRDRLLVDGPGGLGKQGVRPVDEARFPLGRELSGGFEGYAGPLGDDDVR